MDFLSDMALKDVDHLREAHRSEAFFILEHQRLTRIILENVHFITTLNKIMSASLS